MKRILVTSSILATIGGAAFAGGYTAPQPAAPVAAPAPAMVAPVNYDWTGFYGGAQIGYGKSDGAFSGNGVVGGVHAGYLKDFGQFVGGGELAFSAADVKDGTNGKIKNMADLKLIGGVPYQNVLFYGALGASHMKADIGGTSYSDTVPMVGIGAKYALGNNWSVGSELDYRKGSNFDNSGSDLKGTTLNLTASYKF